MSEYILGIDFGTGSCKVAAVDHRGNLFATVSRSYPTYTPQPGWAEQVPDDWLTGASMRSPSLKKSSVA